MQELTYIFLTFIIYSMLGWLMEVTLCSVEEKHFVDRGFLIGPYCPIYGTGTLILILILTKYHDDLLALFVIGTFICSVVEYLTSFAMEKLFKARWWDYSTRKFNLNGRICLTNSILFGLGGIIILYVNPIVQKFLHMIPFKVLSIIAIVVFVIYLVDNIVSFKLINKIKHLTFEARKDNTDEITIKINKIIHEKSKSLMRIIKAFPNAIIYTKNKKKL